MQVKDLMTRTVITVKPENTVNEVAELLEHYHFTGVPVVDDNDTLVGLIAERDFIASDSELYLPTYIKLLTDINFVRGDNKRLAPAAKKIINATAQDIMNKNIVTTDADMELTELAEMFATKRVNPIPVVDKKKKLIGIISRSDLIKLFSTKHIAKALNTEHENRVIDDTVQMVQQDFKNRFAFVAKFRANIWMTTAIVLFIIGFLAGIVYVVNPAYFTGSY